ncbi:MAG: hypothetical protein ACLGSD_13185 [Acidobacteriota bacterium]
MRSQNRPCRSLSVAILSLACFISAALRAQAPAPAGAANDRAARISELGHKLLNAAYRSNALAGPALKPWHLKATFEMLAEPTAKKPVTGTFEEWYVNPYHWRRTYTSTEPAWNGSEWRISKTQRFGTRRRHSDFEEYRMDLRVGRPVVDPLYQIANIEPADQLSVERVNTAGLTLNCTSLTHPPSDFGRAPEWFVPTMCFDPELHLRLIRSQITVVQFLDLQPFQGRSVARTVQVIDGGRLLAEMKVTQLETADKFDDALLKPGPDAQQQPIPIEPGDPLPIPIYEVGASLPLMPDHRPYRGTVFMPVIIHKDGSVKVEAGSPLGIPEAVFDALTNAVNRWKFKPYLIDGQPVEVEYHVQYSVDGKPFVPSYEHAAQKSAGVTPAQD